MPSLLRLSDESFQLMGLHQKAVAELFHECFLNLQRGRVKEEERRFRFAFTTWMTRVIRHGNQ